MTNGDRERHAGAEEGRRDAEQTAAEPGREENRQAGGEQRRDAEHAVGGADHGAEVEQAASSPEHEAHRLRRGVVFTGVLAVLLIGIVAAVPSLRGVFERISDASVGWLPLAIALEVGSCLGYVAVVRLILARGPAPEVRRLAWAEMAFGVVVPAGGAGGLAVGAWAMRAWGISWSRIANRSAVIFLLTSAVNVIVLGLGGIGVWLGIGTDRSGALYGLIPAAVGFSALAAFCVTPFVHLPKDRLRPLAFVTDRVGSWVRDTMDVVFHPHWRALGAVSYLLLDIATLWVCLRAVGVSSPLLALVVGYQVGYLANMIPVPGGLGVLDGGLLGALVLYGLPAAQTGAAVVIYHAIALWIPTIGGTIGFAQLRRAVVHGRTRARVGPPAGASSMKASG